MSEMDICAHCDDLTAHDDGECKQCGLDDTTMYQPDTGDLSPAEQFAYRVEAAAYDDLPEDITYNEETGDDDTDVELPEYDPDKPLDEQYEEEIEQ